jgi:hypothetical protein
VPCSGGSKTLRAVLMGVLRSTLRARGSPCDSAAATNVVRALIREVGRPRPWTCGGWFNPTQLPPFASVIKYEIASSAISSDDTALCRKISSARVQSETVSIPASARQRMPIVGASFSILIKRGSAPMYGLPLIGGAPALNQRWPVVMQSGSTLFEVPTSRVGIEQCASGRSSSLQPPRPFVRSARRHPRIGTYRTAADGAV